MGFGNFKTVVEVATTFNLKTSSSFFVKTLSFDIPEYEEKRIRKKLIDPLSFISEEAICEDIIKPILDVLDDHYKNFRVWSHVTYNVDTANNLSGRPDFLVAPTTEIQGQMAIPPLCIIEAKKENWDEAWAQAVAEMYAASTQGATACYAAVTTGDLWQFGMFDKKCQKFVKHETKIYATDEPPATDNLQKVFDTLNWMFNEASKVTIEGENHL